MKSKRPISKPVTIDDRANMNELFRRNIASLHNSHGDVFYSQKDDVVTESYLLSIKDDTGNIIAGLMASAPEVVIYAKVNKMPQLTAMYSFAASKVREIKLLAVDKEYRKEGLARNLLLTLEEEYEQEGFTTFYGSFDSKADQQALTAFYRKAGYNVVKGIELPDFFDRKWWLQSMYTYSQDARDRFRTRPSIYFYKELGNT